MGLSLANGLSTTASKDLPEKRIKLLLKYQKHKMRNFVIIKLINIYINNIFNVNRKFVINKQTNLS
jgi:hypothetical protein